MEKITGVSTPICFSFQIGFYQVVVHVFFSYGSSVFCLLERHRLCVSRTAVPTARLFLGAGAGIAPKPGAQTWPRKWPMARKQDLDGLGMEVFDAGRSI